LATRAIRACSLGPYPNSRYFAFSETSAMCESTFRTDRSHSSADRNARTEVLRVDGVIEFAEAKASLRLTAGKGGRVLPPWSRRLPQVLHPSQSRFSSQLPCAGQGVLFGSGVRTRSWGSDDPRTTQS
jgi:hypothetical protein